MAEMGGHQKSGERVKINVGGTVFETTVSTLTRLDNTVGAFHDGDKSLAKSGRDVRGQESDLFSKVLDYLRDGENVTLPKEDEAREALRKEAEFYNLPGLSKMCAPYTSVSKDDKGFEVRSFCQGDIVQWKESAIELYWKYFVRYLYELESRIFSKTRTLLCMACGEYSEYYVGPSASVTNVDVDKVVINYDNWIPLRQHMPYMKGKVTSASHEKSCCTVEWGSLRTHIPQSALRKRKY